MAGCSTTPADLEREQSTQSEKRSYRENYQEIYRRVVNAATRCSAGNMTAYASMAVDSQLYSELNFGEVSLSLINVGVRNYYWKAKIEKASSGSIVKVFSGNTINNSVWLNKLFRWADGDDAC